MDLQVRELQKQLKQKTRVQAAAREQTKTREAAWEAYGKAAEDEAAAEGAVHEQLAAIEPSGGAPSGGEW